MNDQVLWYASRATGAVSLVLFTAVLVLGLLTAGRRRLAGLPRAGVLRLHRNLALLAVTLLAVHVVSAIVDGYVDLGLWDVVVPFGAGYDPFWIGLAAVAVDLLLAIGLTSALRRHLPVRVWKGVHLTAYLMWPLALLHGFGVSGGDGRERWMLVVDAVCILAVLAALAVRLRPDRHPDRVARAAVPSPGSAAFSSGSAPLAPGSASRGSAPTAGGGSG